MVTKAQNKVLTEVGRGTPGGELLRRYWMPICPVAELKGDKPKKRVRILGEDLVLFRDGSGRYGLVEEQCRHRRASLYFGFVEDDGIRCPYHGWKYDVTGACIEMPFEAPDTPLLAKACQPSYPVVLKAGILFTYMGPQPAPLMPNWENIVRKDGTRRVLVLPLHRCNWLQAQENSLDSVHTFYLHGMMLKSQGVSNDATLYYTRPILSYDFQLCNEPTWSGIRKSRVFGGEHPETEGGHPAIFPNLLFNPQYKKLVGNRMVPRELVTHWRVPVDDENTYIICACFAPDYENGAESDQRDEDIPVTYLPDPHLPDGEYDLSFFEAQDLMAWETQGRIADRSEELLGASDRGVVMFRRMLQQQIEAVQAGKDPVGVIRDPKINDIIQLYIPPN